jgi:hypothetical protein
MMKNATRLENPHADVRIDLYAPQRLRGLRRRVEQRHLAAGGALVLDFLRCLPEEQVRLIVVPSTATIISTYSDRS